MEGGIYGNWRILAATVFSVVIIIGTYLFARGVEAPPVAQASTETALLQAIATKDSDNDGLPDWEEALYGTDPQAADSRHLGMTDGQAVAKGLIVPKAIADVSFATASSSDSLLIDPSLPPAPADGTLTAAFAKNFFALYLSAKQQKGGADLTESETSAIADQALSTLSSAITPAPDFKSAKDLTVSGSGPDALKAFAASAEAVLLNNKANATTSEINYLKYAILGGDTAAFTHIISIAKAYRDSAVGLAVLPVPKELADADLALVNAMMRVSEITSDFTRAKTDTLATMLALKQYPQAVLNLGSSFINIGKIYKAANLSLPAGAPGASFVNLMTDIASEQAAAKKP